MDIKSYYATQSKITSPGKYGYLYDGLPDDVPTLCKIVQGLVMHYADEVIFDYKIPHERYNEMNSRHVENMLFKIMHYDDKPLIYSRDSTRRIIGSCRDMAILLCSILRHKHIPARLRMMYVDFVIPRLYLDATWVESWDSIQEKWVYTDARMNSDFLNYHRIYVDFNPYDIPESRTFSAAYAWQACRENKINANRFGYREYRGLWYMRNRLLHDLAMLNKKEMLPWDAWSMMLTEKNMTNYQLTLMDNLSQFIKDNAYHIEALQKYYSHPLFCISDVITVYNPFHDEISSRVDV